MSDQQKIIDYLAPISKEFGRGRSVEVIAYECDITVDQAQSILDLLESDGVLFRFRAGTYKIMAGGCC